MARDYLTVAEAIDRTGLRIAFTQGVPGPWGEAVKAIMNVKRIDFAPVVQIGGEANEDLHAWTGQNSAPCAVLNDERPRSHWSEILMLAERLAPEPRLIPADEDERMTMFGIAHELCGEDGFGWSARLLMLHIMEQAQLGIALDGMRRKFDNAAPLAHSARRANEIMAALARRLTRQQEAGSPYLVGQTLTAADFYWACFSNLVAPMDDNCCPMPDYYRHWAAGCAALIGDPVPDILIRHRDVIADRHMDLPMWF